MKFIYLKSKDLYFRDEYFLLNIKEIRKITCENPEHNPVDHEFEFIIFHVNKDILNGKRAIGGYLPKGTMKSIVCFIEFKGHYDDVLELTFKDSWEECDKESEDDEDESED